MRSRYRALLLLCALFAAVSNAVMIASAQAAYITEYKPPAARFDAAEGLFRFKLPNGGEFTSDTPNGAILSGSFSVSFPPTAQAAVYRDGNLVEYASGDILSDEGVYLIQMRIMPEGGTNIGTAFFSTRILRGADNNLDVITPPSGFEITRAALNGTPLTCEPLGTRLAADGYYEFSFSPVSGTAPSRELSVTRDTSAPIIIFSQNALGGFSDTPVLYAPGESGAEVFVFLNGRRIEPGGVLAGDGFYNLRARDEAGNIRDYYINIKLKKRLSPLNLIFLVPAAFVLCIWIRRVRRVRII